MALPVQAPSIDRGFARGAASDQISPSTCCNYSCNGKDYGKVARNCTDCEAIAKADCGPNVITHCTCGGGLGGM